MTPHQPIATRLRSLPVETVQGREVPVAVGFRARLLGLAGLSRRVAGAGLLIPRCRGVHTFGMRFSLDIHFLDEGGEVVSTRRAVRPRRLVSHRAAVAVLEIPCGKGGEFAAPGD